MTESNIKPDMVWGSCIFGTGFSFGAEGDFDNFDRLCHKIKLVADINKPFET